MDSFEDIVKEIRMKYAEDLEEILECPVCLELPKGEILMCTQGHHICSSCMNALINLGEKCPTCKNSFSTCRNYAAENLCSKFEDIKSSILDPRHASNRRVLKDKVSVCVQTETNASYQLQRYQIKEETAVSKDQCDNIVDTKKDNLVNK